MKFSVYKKILEKYHKGESSEAERQLVDGWYDSFELVKPKVEGFATAEERQPIKERMLTKLRTETLLNPERRFYKTKLRVGMAAAMLLLTFGTLGVLYRSSDHPLAGNRQEIGPVAQRFSTTVGERKKLRLPDGSTLTLNANSRVNIRAGYGKGQRVVELDGEAFFDIKPQLASAFKVLTADVVVQVLGTSFNVKAYTNRKKVQIAVSTGNVRVKNIVTEQSLLLAADESCAYDRKEGRFVVHNGALDRSWLEGEVVLDRADFLELAATFHDMYGIVLKSDDAAVLQNYYTITLKNYRTASETMETICHILNKQYRKEVNGELIIF